MSVPRHPSGRKAKARPPFIVLDPHAAGIDVGAAEHWVAVPPDADPVPVRCFGTCTADLAGSHPCQDDLPPGVVPC